MPGGIAGTRPVRIKSPRDFACRMGRRWHTIEAMRAHAARPTNRGAVMLRILGNRKRLCNGLTRRELLTAGGLSLFGLGLHDFFRLRDARAGGTPPAAGANDRFGQARACILLYLYGSPCQLELADPKPEAPVEF